MLMDQNPEHTESVDLFEIASHLYLIVTNNHRDGPGTRKVPEGGQPITRPGFCRKINRAQ